MIRETVREYTEKLKRASEKALELPKAVEGEEYGYACYLYTPGEKKVSAAWETVKKECLADANPAEVMIILQSILPLYGENDSFRGRTGSCGDYEDIECPLKYLYNDVWYCVKQRVENMSFDEKKEIPLVWIEAELPSFITDFNDEYSLVPSQCWMNDSDIQWPPDDSPEAEKAEFTLNIFIFKAPKSAVKIDRLFSLMNNTVQPVFEKYRTELYRTLTKEQDLWTLETLMELAFSLFERTGGKMGKDIIERFIEMKLFYDKVLNECIPRDCKFYSLMKQVPFNYEFVLAVADKNLIQAMGAYWDSLAMKLVYKKGVKPDVYYLGRILFAIAGYRDRDYDFFFQALMKILENDTGVDGEKIFNAVEKVLSAPDTFSASEAEWLKTLNDELLKIKE